MMRYFKKLIGDKCYLSPINIDDAEQYCEWINDLEIGKYLVFASQQIALQKEKDILSDMIRNKSQTFAIVEKNNDKLIGNCSLFNINNIDGTAEIGIFIGDKTFWGKGFGTEATKLILDYGFNILNLTNILLEVYNYNHRAIKSYEKVGFKMIGERRLAKKIGGKRYDVIFMDILKNEFESIYCKNIVQEQ